MLITAYTIVLGLILHELPEGFAMANAYLQDCSLGIMVAIAIALHNIPEKFATVVPLLAAGESKKTFLTSACYQPWLNRQGRYWTLWPSTFFPD